MSSRSIRKTKPSTIRAKSRNKKIGTVAAIVIIAVLIAGVLFVTMGNPANNVNPTPTPTPTPTPSPVPGATPVPEYTADSKLVVLQTSLGNITIQLRNDKPTTTQNFLNLVNAGKYDGTIFHRVIAGFMIQGGDPTGTGYGDPSIPSIPDEIGTNNTNVRGTIAMANTGQFNSASSQFFINTVDNGNNDVPALGSTQSNPATAKFDATYTQFGRVISGMDIVDAISHVATDASSRPLQNVALISATVLP